MIKYRKDIDGLRAFAVLPVVLYHANFSGLSGGFVGVDVFFVISGFLITQILIKDMEDGSYSLSDFYARRIRRILPALLAMLMFVLAAAPFFLLPSEFSGLWKEALGTLFFVANIVYWRDSGYFSPDAEAKPLLHMWSLGIEEQFYIFAPLALWLALKYGRKYLSVLIASLALLSFIASAMLTERYAGASFYLLPTRAWELLAGAFLASLRFERPTSTRATFGRELLASAGLACLITAAVTFSKATSFPGYAAALPVIGSVLLIRFAETTIIGSILSLRPVVFIGAISYSLYLWHWPLVVFFRDLGWLEISLGRVTVVALAIVMAWLSWRFIENPTRNRKGFSNKRLAALSVTGVMIVCGVSGIYSTLGGWPGRVSEQVAKYDAGRFDVSPSRASCHIDSGLRDPASFCILGRKKEPSIAVWGDSHGVEIAQALANIDGPVMSITYSSCPPDLGVAVRRHRPFCSEHNRRVVSYLESNSTIHTVVLTAYYKDMNRRLPEMAAVARHLRIAGKRVIVVGPTPTLEAQQDLPSHLARGGSPTIPAPRATESFAQSFHGIAEVVLPEQIFCKKNQCSMTLSGEPILFDGHHPSMTGASAIAKAVAVQLNSLPPPDPFNSPGIN